LKKQRDKDEKYIPSSRKLKFQTEVPYNHYGDRGFIDLIMTTMRQGKIERKHMIEFKTEIRDLGEMLRQYKRMRRYYPEDDQDDKEKWFNGEKGYISLLVVKNNKENNRILVENKDYIGSKIFSKIRIWDPEDKKITFGKELLKDLDE